jgi:integrase
MTCLKSRRPPFGGPSLACGVTSDGAWAGDGNRTPHLRHPPARKGTSLRVVQEALGHTSLRTTSVYVSLARELMDQQLQANAL